MFALYALSDDGRTAHPFGKVGPNAISSRARRISQSRSSDCRGSGLPPIGSRASTTRLAKPMVSA